MNLSNYEMKVFKTIVEKNGFQRASESLYISQSAVSQCLSNLENRLGTTLLIRKGSLKLTEAGNRLLNYANHVLQEEQEVLEDLENIVRGIDITLSLAINSTINRFYIADLILRFLEAHPSAKFKIDHLPSREIIYTVLAGKRELGFGPFQKHMAAFESIPLFEGERDLVISPICPFFEALKENPDVHLHKIPLITSYLDDPELRPSMERIRDRFSTVWQINSAELRLALVNAGKGATYLGHKFLKETPECRDLVVLKKSNLGSIKRNLGLYYKKGIPLSKGASRFIEICKDRWKK